MRKLIYEIKDTDGNIIQTVTTLKEKQEAEKNGYTATDKLEDIKSFQPWVKSKEDRAKKPSKYHKFVMDRFDK